MTEQDRIEAERDARKDAEDYGLKLLVALLLSASAARRGLASEPYVTFDRTRAAFLVDGRTVTAKRVIAEIEKLKGKAALRITRSLQDLANDKITFAEWKRSFDRTITSTHILAAAYAVGGIFYATRTALVTGRIDSELRYADALAREIRSTASRDAVIKFIGRARGYVQAAHITYSTLEWNVLQASGIRREARNILRPAEHCSTKNNVIGCPELSSRGWMVIDEMVPVGQRACSRWCRCYIVYR